MIWMMEAEDPSSPGKYAKVVWVGSLFCYRALKELWVSAIATSPKGWAFVDRG